MSGGLMTKGQVAARAGKLRVWRRSLRQADEAIELARIYRMDGALMSAAETYRWAAALIEKASAARSSWMDAQ